MTTELLDALQFENAHLRIALKNSGFKLCRLFLLFLSPSCLKSKSSFVKSFRADLHLDHEQFHGRAERKTLLRNETLHLVRVQRACISRAIANVRQLTNGTILTKLLKISFDNILRAALRKGSNDTTFASELLL